MDGKKYSIIVPVYNTGDYLYHCLDSIKKQSYKNFEAIIVNDGSTDNSGEIINNYQEDKRFVIVNQNNMGVSMARNNGISKATGEYIVFLDSDDYLDKNYLEVVNKEFDDDLDILKIGASKIGEDTLYNNVSFPKINSDEAIIKLLTDSFMETVWSYVFNARFFKDNNFLFPKGRVHEDFGTIPIILEKASKIKAIDNKIYNYVLRPGSIMQTINAEAQDRKFSDALYLYNDLKNKLHNKYLISYLTNGIIIKYFSLSKESQKKYKKALADINIADYLASDNLKRWLKKKYYQFYFR